MAVFQQNDVVEFTYVPGKQSMIGQITVVEVNTKDGVVYHVQYGQLTLLFPERVLVNRCQAKVVGHTS